MFFLPDSKTVLKPVYLCAAALAVLAALPRMSGTRMSSPGRRTARLART